MTSLANCCQNIQKYELFISCKRMIISACHLNLLCADGCVQARSSKKSDTTAGGLHTRSMALTSAPASSRCLTVCRWPLCAARIRGVSFICTTAGGRFTLSRALCIMYISQNRQVTKGSFLKLLSLLGEAGGTGPWLQSPSSSRLRPWPAQNRHRAGMQAHEPCSLHATRIVCLLKQIILLHLLPRSAARPRHAHCYRVWP
jgi:hypothetical protein